MYHGVCAVQHACGATVSADTRRVLARISIAVCFLSLALQCVGVQTIHHSLGWTVFGMALPVLGILCGLEYLRSTRRRP